MQAPGRQLGEERGLPLAASASPAPHSYALSPWAVSLYLANRVVPRVEPGQGQLGWGASWLRFLQGC